MSPGIRRILAIVLLGALPVVTVVVMFAVAHDSASLARDFHNELYPEAKLLLDWENPFPGPDHPLEEGKNLDLAAGRGVPGLSADAALRRRGRLGDRAPRARRCAALAARSSASATGACTARSRCGPP